ncbi:MAG: TetR/AcrR family transcriptional regulator [Pseudomonadota bacterium]
MRTSKEEIQEKAMELFLKKGYHGMSTTDLCEALGISKPTLYWYFKDKEDILFSVHKDRLESRVRPILGRMEETDDPLARLRIFIHEYTRAVCLYPDTKVLINETAYLAPEHLAWVRKLWTKPLDLLRQALRDLKEEGKVKDTSDTFAAFSLIGMVMWTFNWFDHSRPESIGELTDTIEEIFFSGLLKAGISWRTSGLGNQERTKTRTPKRTPGEDVSERAAATPARRARKRTG